MNTIGKPIRYTPHVRHTIDAFERRSAPSLVKFAYSGGIEFDQGRSIATGQLGAVIARAINNRSTLIAKYREVMADETLTMAGREAAFRRDAQRMLMELDEQFTHALNMAEGELNLQRERIDLTLAPPGQVGESAIDVEFRTLLRAADPATRLSIIGSDPAARRAAATAPAALSSLSADAHRRAQAEHVEAMQPEAFAAYNAVQAGLKAAQAARSALERDILSLTELEPVKADPKASTTAA